MAGNLWFWLCMLSWALLLVQLWVNREQAKLVGQALRAMRAAQAIDKAIEDGTFERAFRKALQRELAQSGERARCN